MTAMVGCGDDDDKTITCSDVDCGSVSRSCIEAVGPLDAYCGGCSIGYFDKDGTCTEATVCADTEYETTAATATSDRACADLTECETNQYEKSAPTATSDRACAALSECRGSDGQTPLFGQRTPSDGTATNDRVCCHVHTSDIEVRVEGDWPQFDEECLHVKGDVDIHDYNMMDDRLVAVEGDVNPYGYMNNLQVFKNLAFIGGDLWFEGKHHLVNFQGLEKLQSIGGYLDVSDNGNLENFRGLESLRELGEGFRIIGNDSLVSFEGLEQLTKIGGDFAVGGTLDFPMEFWVEGEGNASLVNFKGLENLKVIEGEFNVFRNDELINFEGLESLKTIEGNVFVGLEFSELGVHAGNAKLENFRGLESLEIMDGLFLVAGNKTLVNFDGLERLTTIPLLSVQLNAALCADFVDLLATQVGLLPDEYSNDGNMGVCP